MRSVTATLGAIFVFAGTFVLSAILVAFLSPAFHHQVHLGVFHTNNPVGLFLALLAASASFRATLRRAQVPQP